MCTSVREEDVTRLSAIRAGLEEGHSASISCAQKERERNIC